MTPGLAKILLAGFRALLNQHSWERDMWALIRSVNPLRACWICGKTRLCRHRELQVEIALIVRTPANLRPEFDVAARALAERAK